MRLDFSDIPGGFILADSTLGARADWFEPDYWRSHGAAEPIGRGRGEAIVAGETGAWVLRHFHRGGLPGRFFNDGYVWLGVERSRPVREMRVLNALIERGAPVAKPVAVRVLRSGLRYRGDILTERVVAARTLAECALNLDEAGWREVGAAIAAFHAARGWHADLNAHNLLITTKGVFIIDLDRGRLVKPGSTRQRRNLDRLERSLAKLGLLPEAASGWQALLDAYRAESSREKCRSGGPRRE
jgi:3-deoxy-D-manno-octulosonic acid kinase